MPFARIADDLELCYQVDDFTDPWTEAPWIVLMHGVAESSDAWYAWIPHLARRYKVLRFDVRGFGRSTPMPRGHAWSFERIGEDLAALTDQLRIERFHLVAAKVGGTMALDFASRRPPQLRTLTVLGTPVEGASSRKIGYSSREIEEQGVGHWARRTMASRLGRAMPAAGQEWWARMMERTPVSTQAGFMDFLPTVDVRPQLHRIACPTLVVTSGSADNPAQNITNLETVRAWQSLIPRSELRVMPQDSFHVAATDPDRAAEITLEFIERHAGA